MKSLQESLLDNDDESLDRTDIFNEGFPSPKDVFISKITIIGRWSSPKVRARGGDIKNITGYYWHNPALFKKAGDKYTGIYVYFFKTVEGYEIGMNLEINNNKLVCSYGSGKINIKNKEFYSKVETKKLLYKFLTYLKDNPSFIDNLESYLEINRFRWVDIEDIIK